MRSHPGTIFYDYLASSAPLELNLPEFLRDKAFDAWLCSDPEECFDCVKPAVMALLENSWKEFLLDPSSQFLREKLFMSIHTFQDLSIAAQFVIELLNSRYFPATEETTTFTDEVAALLHSKLLHLLNSFFGGTLPPSLLTLLLHQKSQDQEDLTLISTPENFNVIDSPLSSPQKSYIMDTSFKDCVFKLSKSRFPSRNSRNLSLSDDENEVSEDCQSDSSLNCGSSMKNSGFEFFISDMPKYKKGPNWKSIWRWAFVDKPCRV
ncbi:hypothetical protein HMI56_002530 [Coelomomyces lativittatus]|nr:hypothetical protein HMI56_002530 [Coelomomyces lativittatus]